MTFFFLILKFLFIIFYSRCLSAILKLKHLITIYLICNLCFIACCMNCIDFLNKYNDYLKIIKYIIISRLNYYLKTNKLLYNYFNKAIILSLRHIELMLNYLVKKKNLKKIEDLTFIKFIIVLVLKI